MLFCGLQKLAMVDYPGKLAATVFTGGCNLQCPFCHNALLVTRLNETPSLTETEILDFLSSRQKLLDGVVLTGGEPLLHPDAADFLRKVRAMGFFVKLDTNGCFPNRLAPLLAEGLVDYVAMDIKNCLEKYSETCGVSEMDLAPVLESIRLLRNSGVEFEFRTTAVRELHTADDFLAIGRWLEGAPQYFIQNFVDSGNLIETGYHGFTPQELQCFADLVRPYFGTVALRGV
ncbi:pyruvate formate lyase activating enzyme [Oscillibacter sp. PC13]|uniref:anaerobic ribonucleoside-triphosphate reductase activating protein n=1 Tax=Oscillibacter sp. PC13 TaxID=1855299 RepID=UPI0008E1E2F9|nr:anaerobic ribonucleoside-triphosphate reductase activating protein [Oscillibacter sp. PC13]SFP99491.1 pyruvate formate lyase activating enzyme [Oscillibacter sp. PC13]